MAIGKQPSRNFRKVCFKACLPDKRVRKQVSQSSEDIK